jgi:hypothetical protein
MSIYGIGGSNIQRPTTQAPIRDNGRTQGGVQQPAIQRMPAQIPAPAQAPATAKSTPTVPAEPPPGTDPALWSVLSGEERAFFAKAGAMGPLTYGRALREMTSAQLPVARGGRLDVKI